jgi:hypothetical protein
MLFKQALAIFLAAACSAMPVAASAGFDLAVDVSRSFGDTHYEMNARTENPAEPGEIVDIRSRLEFPIEASLIGLTVNWQPGEEEPGRWAFGAGAHTNVTDPPDPMIDEDWVGSKQLAYSESDAQMDMIVVTADVDYLFRKSERTAFALLFHADYRRVEQYLVGFEGWRGSLFSDEQYPASGTAPVVDYEVNYLSGQFGAAATYLWSAHSRLGARASAGVAYASDTDDHLLRGRIAEGKCWGVGMNSRVEFELLPGFAPPDWLWASLVGELSFFHTEGEVDQRWYRDEDMPEGTVIADLPYELESLQYRVSLSAGASF